MCCLGLLTIMHLKPICNAIIICLIITLISNNKPLFAGDNLFHGSVYKVTFSKSNPTKDVMQTFDAFCLDDTGKRTTLSDAAVKRYKDATSNVFSLYDLGLTECPSSNSLHLMGHRYFTGAGSRVHVAIYKKVDTWVSVWFHATQADISFTTEHEAYIRALVHPIYCTDFQDECEASMLLP